MYLADNIDEPTYWYSIRYAALTAIKLSSSLIQG